MLKCFLLLAIIYSTVIVVQMKSFSSKEIPSIETVMKEPPKEHVVLWLTGAIPNAIELLGHNFNSHHHFIGLGNCELIISPNVTPGISAV